jgi:hypothetical protein
MLSHDWVIYLLVSYKAQRFWIVYEEERCCIYKRHIHTHAHTHTHYIYIYIYSQVKYKVVHDWSNETEF